MHEHATDVPRVSSDELFAVLGRLAAPVATYWLTMLRLIKRT